MNSVARTLQSIWDAPANHTDKRFPTATLLCDLLKLADHVLAEEYASPGQLDDLAEHALTGPLSCDFCGADIFQSFFICGSSCTPPASEGGEGDNIMVCPMCYVEGRSCPCDRMQPAQVPIRPLTDLITQRNAAAKTLNLQKLSMKAPELNDGCVVELNLFIQTKPSYPTDNF